MNLPEQYPEIQTRQRRMTVTLLLGFSSGLPLALSGGTLQAWFATADVDIRSIAWVSLLGLPYLLKFVWAPLMDRYVPAWLGRRRGWLLLTQLSLLLTVVALGALSPEHQLPIMLWLGLLVAFCSASQDIAVDAYRTDLLPASERGLGAAFATGGYRTGMLLAGAGALILADVIGWHWTYWLLAACLGLGLLGTALAPAPLHRAPPPVDLRSAVIDPWRDFLGRNQALLLLAFIVLYKLGDAFAGTLTTAFLIQGLGYSTLDVGLVGQAFGWIAMLGGAVYGGVLMLRWTLFKALLIFGLLQAVTNIGFIILALIGPNYPAMVVVVGLENVAGGMGTAAFLALLMALCNPRYTATQFALLSAVAATGRVLVGPAAGELVFSYGWTVFFCGSFLIAIPGLLLLLPLRMTLTRLK